MRTVKYNNNPLKTTFSGLATMVIAILILAISSEDVAAAPGDVDQTFNAGIFTNFTGNGISVNTIKLQPDGKIVVGGIFETVQGASRLSIARLNADGSLDPTFTSPFIYNLTQSQVFDIEILASGKMLVGGYLVTPAGVKRLMRLNADGTVDNTFDADPNNGGLDMVVQADGSIVVIGASSGARLLGPDGALIASFATTSVTNAHALAVQTGGNPILAGDYLGFQSVSRWLTSVAPDGQLDGSFNSSFGWFSADGGIGDIALEADGDLIVSGSFSTIQGQTRSRLARFTANGTLDSGFVTQLSLGSVSESLVQPDGKILSVGRFFFTGDSTVYQSARFNSDGSLDNGFTRLVEPIGVSSVNTLSLQPDGKILVGGTFTEIGGVARQMIARLNATDSPQNSPPTLTNISATGPITEGGSTTLAGNISDPDTSDAFTLSVNWGDGSNPQDFNYPAGSTSFSVTHAYADNPNGQATGGSYTIGVTITDTPGASDTDTTSVNVNNAAPAINSLSASPASISVGGSSTLNGTFTDVGTLDTFTINIDWGDGSSSTQLSGAAGASSFNYTHQYNLTGSFTITATVADDDGGESTSTTLVTVSTPVAIPTAPTGLVASAVSGTQINLSWIDNASNEDGYRVERCNKGKNCTNFVQIAQLAPGSTSFQNTGLARGTEYRYRVRAFNTSGTSAYSNIASAKTPRK